MIRRSFSRFAVGAMLLTCPWILLNGCAASKQARSVETSGFLEDYSQLVPGEDGQALLRYADPDADWSKYSKIILDSIAIYAAPDSDLGELEEQERQVLVNYFDAALRREFGKSCEFVTSPGPDVLRIRVAITDADSSNRLSDTVSNIIPIGLALSALKEIAFGKPIGVGDVQVEAEFVDSTTGRRLAAGVDRRVGGKRLRGKFDKWGDAKDSFDFWAESSYERFLEFKGQ